MDHRERRCGECGHLNPPTAEFCADCGEFLARVAPSSLARVQQTQFALPDYLLMAREREREERRRRMAAESGEGVGLLWLGACAAVVALWFGGGVGPGALIFPLGLLGVLIGLWRLRRDTRNMARAGTATVVVSSMVLGAALAQTMGFAGTQVAVPERAVAAPTPTPDPAESPRLALTADEIVPMFRGNASRTGENPGPAPLARPLVKWKTFVGGESYASPVVGTDAVYVATKAGSLVALSVANGEERWRTDIGDYVARSTPALAGSRLFVAAGYALLAIDTRSGDEVWREPLRFAGSCSPVVDGEFVYVATQEGHVSAFSQESGKERWHYRNDNLLFGSPAVADGVVIFGDETGQVTALDEETGRERWQKAIDGDIFATPAIADGVAYVVTNEPEIVALDARNGKELWRRGVGGESSPAVHDGVIYLGGDDQSLRAINAKTGDVDWSSPLGYAIESSATVSGDAILLASGPTINALNAADGQTLWTHVTGDTISADVAVAGGMVIASSHDGYVYALAAPEEQPGETAPRGNSPRGVSLGASR